MAVAACGDEFGPEPDGPDRAPTFEDVELTTDEDTPVTATLDAADPDGDTVEVTVEEPVNGTLTVDGLSVTYTPDENFHGVERLRVTVTAAGRTTAGQLTITVTPVNDAPAAADDTLAATEDVVQAILPVLLLANDSDIDGDALTVSAVSNPSVGTVELAGNQVLFTAPADFAGDATFDYTVSDGAATATATVTVQIGGVNDPPVAGDDAATTDEDTPVTVTVAELVANDTDADGQTLSITTVGGAVGGTVVQTGTNVTFTPAADFAGTAGFAYLVTDGELTDTGVVTVTVNPINDAPVAVDDVATTSANTAVAIEAADLLANDDDVDGPSVTVAGVANASSGTVSLSGTTVTYTPAADFTGEATFEYTITDGALTDTGVVTVTVTGECGNGAVEFGEECDDDNTVSGDGCSAECVDELCGDGIVNDAGAETCDDANGDDLDGCTTECQLAPVCDATWFPGGDRFGVLVANHHCYVSFDDDEVTFDDASAACEAIGGYLATLTSIDEDGFVTDAVRNQDQDPWIGAVDDANDTDAVFAWVTGEPWGYTGFAPDEPDDDVGVGGNGECLHINGGAGWADTNCDFAGHVTGYICEIEAVCGDGVVEGIEECDDGNADDLDGCSAFCTVEPPVLVINEVDYDQASTDSASFIEIYNAGTGAATLADYAVVLINGNGGTQYARFDLGGAATTLAAGGYLVIANPTVSANGVPRIDASGDFIQNGGPDAVALFEVATSTLVDALSYEGSVTITSSDFGSGISLVSGTAFTGADTNADGPSLCRQPNGGDTGDDATDWALCATPTPGAAN